MKKIHIAFAVFAAAALTSCVQEKSFNDHVVGKNEVAFVLQAGASTRSVEMETPFREGISTPIGRVENLNLYLEETVTDLSYFAPETKGTPVFTENVGILYKDKLFVHANGFGDASFATMDDGQVDGGWRYHHEYDDDLWPTDGGAVNFHLVMPVDAIAEDSTGDETPEGVSSLVYASDKAATSFTYLSPKTAAEQQDVIVAGTTLTKKQHFDALPNGAHVTFYHTLTAVKFAIGNTAAELASKGITVTKVEFTGLKNTGTCTVDPSATEDKVSWDASAVANNKITQTFTADENVITFDKDSDENKFGDSFFSAGTSQNVNKADASYTFWLVPQKFDANNAAVLRISYKMSGKEEYLDITLKDILKDANNNPIEWKAGQLRTFTIKLDEVNVKIEDTVNFPETATAENGYKGSNKTGVTITNTGNTPAFIRAAIVGQWLDPDGNPVFGFTDKVNNLYLVESWYEDQFGTSEFNAETSHGKFYDLPGYKGAATFKADSNGSEAGWQLCKDGFYYYTAIVEAGNATGSALFTKYETLKTPKAELAGKVLESADMYFVLEISTQAITAVKMDGHEGSRYTWKEAWKNATGTEPVEK